MLVRVNMLVLLVCQEEDVLDLLAQCEADEREGHSITTSRPPRGPKVRCTHSVYNHATAAMVTMTPLTPVTTPNGTQTPKLGSYVFC